MARLFTLREAERLLPAVERELRRAIELKSTYQNSQQQFAEELRALSMLGGVIPDTKKIAALRAGGENALSELKLAIASIEDQGVLVKDLDMGLIDFLSRYQGREVCLCWKLGEDGIRFWHGADEGFRGRKPIDDEFLANHSGDGE